VLAAFAPDVRPHPLPPRRGRAWEALLDPDERLLWQGRPNGGFHIGWRHGMLATLGVAVLALAVLLAVQGLAGLRTGADAAAAVLAVALGAAGFGLWCIVGPATADMLRRRGTAYALTDRRALIETDFMGYGLAAWPIGPESPLVLVGGRPASVWFAAVRRPEPPLLLRPSRRGTGEIPIGFERIADAETVLRLLEAIREGRA